MKSINLEHLRRIKETRKKLALKIADLDDGSLAYEIAFRAYIFVTKKCKKLKIC